MIQTDTEFDNPNFRPNLEQINAMESGGFGRCYLYLDKSEDKYYVLKVLRGREIKDRTKFEREANSLKSIDFPLVCAIKESSEVPQENSYESLKPNFWLLLDYIPGINLNSYISHPAIRDLSIKPSFLYRIAWGIAYSLQQIHAIGIVHRDIKPHNIIIDGNLFPHIVDLGESAPTDRSSTNNIHGTIFFLPPEINYGNYDYSPKFDVFSLGGTIYNMITREFPFQDLYCYCLKYNDNPNSNPYNFKEDFKRDQTNTYEEKFDSIALNPNPTSFERMLLAYISNEKEYCHKFEPENDHGLFNTLPDCYKDLMRLVYKCFSPIPENRPSSEEVANEIFRLARINLKDKELDDFNIFYEIVKENALERIYGTSEGKDLADYVFEQSNSEYPSFVRTTTFSAY